MAVDALRRREVHDGALVSLILGRALLVREGGRGGGARARS